MVTRAKTHDATHPTGVSAKRYIRGQRIYSQPKDIFAGNGYIHTQRRYPRAKEISAPNGYIESTVRRKPYPLRGVDSPKGPGKPRKAKGNTSSIKLSALPGRQETIPEKTPSYMSSRYPERSVSFAFPWPYPSRPLDTSSKPIPPTEPQREPSDGTPPH